MRIAMLGSRGVPASYGGIERSVEEIGARLSQRGHDVTVFCRASYVSGRPSRYLGMRLRYPPAINSKNFEAASHTLLSAMVSTRGFDVLHYHALGPGLFTPLSRALSPAAVVQTIHGLDSQRAKWGPVARTALTLGEWLSFRVPDEVIVVSDELLARYRSRHKGAAHLIRNGVTSIPIVAPGGTLARYQLAPRDYLLFVGRLVPEKALELLIRAYRRLTTTTPLVIVGGSSHTEDYVRRLRALAADDERIVFTGYVYGEDLAELYSNASAFVLPSTLEGFPIALLEALSCGTPVVVSDLPANVEALAGSDAGMLFRSGNQGSLSTVLASMLAEAGSRRHAAAALMERVRSENDWDSVTARTESVYRQAVARRRGRP